MVHGIVIYIVHRKIVPVETNKTTTALQKRLVID